MSTFRIRTRRQFLMSLLYVLPNPRRPLPSLPRNGETNHGYRRLLSVDAFEGGVERTAAPAFAESCWERQPEAPAYMRAVDWSRPRGPNRTPLVHHVAARPLC